MTRNQEIVKKYRSGKYTLEQLGAEYGVTRERIRQICKEAGYTGAEKMEKERTRKAEAKKRAADQKLVKAIVKAKKKGWTCPVCGSLNVRRGMRDDYRTCSSECSALYVILRPRIDREHWQLVQAKAIVRRSKRESLPKYSVDHAKHVIAGTAGTHPERYYYRPESKAGVAYERMLELRSQLGTEEDRTWA